MLMNGKTDRRPNGNPRHDGSTHQRASAGRTTLAERPEVGPAPIPGLKNPEDVFIRVAYAGICGTDVEFYSGQKALRAELALMSGSEVVLGHEFCGQGDALGSQAAELLARRLMSLFADRPKGDALRRIIAGRTEQALSNHPAFLELLRDWFYVTAEMHRICGHCYTCRTGNGHVCPQAHIQGLQLDGAFARYVVVPVQNLILIPRDEIPPEVIAFMDAIGNDVH